MPENFFRRILTKPPVLFPWVALFHLLMLAYSIWNFSEFPFPSVYWLPVVWQLLYFIAWLFICDLQRVAALSYTVLTVINILLHYTLKYKSEVAIYTPSFLIVYILFSFFVLFYFRKFR